MRTGKALLAAAIALALLTPSTADAAGWTTPRVERAHAAALSWWNETPRCGEIRHRRSTPADIADPKWGYDLSVFAPDWVGIGDPTYCVIHFRLSWVRERPSWSVFCVVYLHEYGHVIGRQHSDDPRSIMHAPPERIPRVCRRPR